MAGLVQACPGHPRLSQEKEGVDARDKPGHDEQGSTTFATPSLLAQSTVTGTIGA